MNKDKAMKFLETILPEQDYDAINEDFSRGFNSCIEKILKRSQSYFDSLE